MARVDNVDGEGISNSLVVSSASITGGPNGSRLVTAEAEGKVAIGMTRPETTAAFLGRCTWCHGEAFATT